MTEGQELEARMVDRAIERAQKRVEGHNFDIRKHLLEYDEVMNRQREFVYEERNNILDNRDVRGRVLTWTEEVLESQILEFCEGNDPTKWEIPGLQEWLRSALGISVEMETEEFRRSSNAQLDLFNKVWAACKTAYTERVESVGEENFNYVERRISLDVIDARWKEHLYAMDQLREGIWAAGFAEKNPLVEFKLEGFRLFDAMVYSVKEQIVEFLFRVQIEGPVSMGPTSRNLGNASHQEIDTFSGNGGMLPGSEGAAARARPVSNRKGETPRTSTSSGGASKRKKSRRRR